MIAQLRRWWNRLEWPAELPAFTPGAAVALARVSGTRTGRVGCPVVYLCGPINGCTDEEAHDWRALATNLLGPGFATLDPMRRDYRGRELEPGIAAEIVRGDLEDLTLCDAVLASCPKPSVGTSMEVCLAFRSGKPVVCVVPPGAGAPSPWLLYHSSAVVRTYAAAVEALRLELGMPA